MYEIGCQHSVEHLVTKTTRTHCAVKSGDLAKKTMCGKALELSSPNELGSIQEARAKDAVRTSEEKESLNSGKSGNQDNCISTLNLT